MHTEYTRKNPCIGLARDFAKKNKFLPLEDSAPSDKNFFFGQNLLTPPYNFCNSPSLRIHCSLHYALNILFDYFFFKENTGNSTLNSSLVMYVHVERAVYNLGELWLRNG